LQSRRRDPRTETMHPLVLPYSPRRPLSRNRKLINYPRMKHSLTESRAYDSRRTVSFLIHVSGDIRQKFGYPILHAIAIDDPRIIASSVLYHCFYLVTFSSAARMAVPHPNQTILLYIFSKAERERERERERRVGRRFAELSRVRELVHYFIRYSS